MIELCVSYIDRNIIDIIVFSPKGQDTRKWQNQSDIEQEQEHNCIPGWRRQDATPNWYVAVLDEVAPFL